MNMMISYQELVRTFLSKKQKTFLLVIFTIIKHKKHNPDKYIIHYVTQGNTLRVSLIHLICIITVQF